MQPCNMFGGLFRRPSPILGFIVSSGSRSFALLRATGLSDAPPSGSTLFSRWLRKYRSRLGSAADRSSGRLLTLAAMSSTIRKSAATPPQRQSQRNASDAAEQFGMQVAVDTAVNVMKEFWPSRERKASRKSKTATRRGAAVGSSFGRRLSTLRVASPVLPASDWSGCGESGGM